LSGLLFLEESLRPLQWLGALLALLSVLLIHQRQPLWQGRWSNVASEEMS
jgi:drug/metabolite transporter (DMT)-like permease